MASSSSITIHHGEPNGPLCKSFLQQLPGSVIAQLGAKASQLPWYSSGAPAPATDMPPGSVFLYAELDEGVENQPPSPVGAVCVYLRQAGTPQGRGLPPNVAHAAEITRMIVLDGYQRRGIAMKLIRAAEEVAKSELGCSYLILETGGLLEYAQQLYEKAGYQRRSEFGAYEGAEGRVYFEKWI